jgi:hypothetical protein
MELEQEVLMNYKGITYMCDTMLPQSKLTSPHQFGNIFQFLQIQLKAIYLGGQHTTLIIISRSQSHGNIQALTNMRLTAHYLFRFAKTAQHVLLHVHLVTSKTKEILVAIRAIQDVRLAKYLQEIASHALIPQILFSGECAIQAAQQAVFTIVEQTVVIHVLQGVLLAKIL